MSKELDSVQTDKCFRCGTAFDLWPYPSHINGVCMECHREAGSFWGLMDEIIESARLA